MTSTPGPSGLDRLVETHRDLLARAVAATHSRGYFSAFEESPSPRAHGEGAAAAGEAAYRARLGADLLAGHPGDGRRVGGEISPFGPALGVTYPHVGAGDLLAASRRALPRWRSAAAEQRAAVCAEILQRLGARGFELAHAVMHTTGQAFVMAFQAGGAHALDRGLEAVAYALDEQQRHVRHVLWEKPQGSRPPLRMLKTFTPVSRGVAVVVGCNTFPTWNSYPGLFASLATGNTVLVKPHPRAVLPLAITVEVAREVLAEAGFDPDVVLLAAEAEGERLAAELATSPEVGVVDFTGSTAFGDWLEAHARQAVVYTEKAGVNQVVLESTDAYRRALGNLAFTLALYSGQMCTTTQNILVPAGGIETDEGHKSVDEVGVDLGAALDRLLADPERATGILGAIVSDDVAARLAAATAADHAPVVASRTLKSEAWPDARIATPYVGRADARDETDRARISAECFGPVSYLVTVADREQALALLTELAGSAGAMTAGVYSSDESFLERAREASLVAGVALSENLTGGVFVNQTAAFSDFHGTGANPAANATLTDGHFVAGRFRVVEQRRHEPDGPGE